MIKRIINSTLTKYTLGGVFSYAVKIALTFVLVDIFQLWYWYAYLTSLTVVIITNFLVNSFFVFRVKNEKNKRFFKYLFSIIIFNTVDGLLVKILTELLSIYYLVSIVIVTTLVFVVKFFVYRFAVFNSNDNTQVTKETQEAINKDLNV